MSTEAPTLYQMQAMAGQNYVTLLQEINSIGLEGFLHMLDACTEEELHDMLSACEVVYRKVQQFKMKASASPPIAPTTG